MSRRSRAREVVLQLLYEVDLNPGHDLRRVRLFLQGRLNDHEELIEFAADLYQGVCRHAEDLDPLLTRATQNWALDRMAATDRNILRLGAYEILYSDTPNRVAINEAVDLAKRFGAKQSPQFVNGVLDRIMQRQEKPDLEQPKNVHSLQEQPEVGSAEVKQTFQAQPLKKRLLAEKSKAEQPPVEQPPAEQLNTDQPEAEQPKAEQPEA